MDQNIELTLAGIIQQHARCNPKNLSLVFMNDDGSELSITAGEFHKNSTRFALSLKAIGIDHEDLVILVLPHSLQLLYAFWGAMYLGAISSIFPFLTEKLDPKIYKERVRDLVIHSAAKAVITFPEFKFELSTLLSSMGCVVLSTADVASPEIINNSDKNWPVYSSDNIAFLQHSSGTTGLQKGIALSNRSVLNQIKSYSAVLEINQDDRIVSWLPLYHDMGLIAGFVLPLVLGIPIILMSPFRWVRDPKVLFQAIHKNRGTICWLPNFAYNHSARVIREKDIKGLDLSSMRAFINCSEPVYYHSHKVFIEKFAAYGLNSDALSTCYAMAENTFAVTQYPIGEAAKSDWVILNSLQKDKIALRSDPEASNATPIVSCGRPISGTEIRILNEIGDELEERHVGEIVLRGNCMLSSYYRRADLSLKSIQNGWYYTGDMGYISDGELFITGRKKDLIIVGGKNIYPQDIEAVANSVEGIVPGRNAAFGIFDPALGSENIVMVCELENGKMSDDELKTSFSRAPSTDSATV